MRRQRISRIGAAGTVLLTLLTVAACSAHVAPSSPTPITADQALAAVQAFAPQASGLHVVGTEAASMGTDYRVESPDVIAAVDQATGLVTMFVDNAAMPTSATVKLKTDDATAAATAWLKAHSVDIAGLTASTTLMDHGDTQEYRVELRATVDGVRVPRVVDISVDPATGAVYGFVRYVRTYAAPPKPTLTLDDATAAARTEEGDPGLKVTASDLAITFDAAGAQQLVWELDTTRTDGFYVKLDVNALTGAVTVVGRG